jgi:hypothetical protein
MYCTMGSFEEHKKLFLRNHAAYQNRTRAVKPSDAMVNIGKSESGSMSDCF